MKAGARPRSATTASRTRTVSSGADVALDHDPSTPPESARRRCVAAAAACHRRSHRKSRLVLSEPPVARVLAPRAKLRAGANARCARKASALGESASAGHASLSSPVQRAASVTQDKQEQDHKDRVQQVAYEHDHTEESTENRRDRTPREGSPPRTAHQRPFATGSRGHAAILPFSIKARSEGDCLSGSTLLRSPSSTTPLLPSGYLATADASGVRGTAARALPTPLRSPRSDPGPSRRTAGRGLRLLPQRWVGY
jgi:hypothetical protein